MLHQSLGDPLPTPADKRQMDSSRGRITMSSLERPLRQPTVAQYGFLRAIGALHGLGVEAPDWICRWLYDLSDPYPRAPLRELREDGDNLTNLLKDADKTNFAIDSDIWGYCCYHAPLPAVRDLLRRLFRPGKAAATSPTRP